MIDKIELLKLNIPLANFFETNFERTYSKRIILVKIYSSEKIGYGECVAGENPFSYYETLATCAYVLREFLIPVVFKRQPQTPEELTACLSIIKEHPVAKSSLETAFWDLQAKKQGIPLYKFLGGIEKEIPAMITLEIKDDLTKLLKRIEDYLKEGYKRLKIKIKPGWDYEIIEEVRKNFPDVPIMVDANSAYSLNDVEFIKKFDEFGLVMIEEPLEYMSFVEYAELQRKIITPVCLDESINSLNKAKASLSIGSCKIINVKPHYLGGFSEARKVYNLCLEKKIPAFTGHMMETGIGRAHNIAFAALPGFNLPADIPIKNNYLGRDLIKNPFQLNSSGNILLSNAPGNGVEVDEEYIETIIEKREVFL